MQGPQAQARQTAGPPHPQAASKAAAGSWAAGQRGHTSPSLEEGSVLAGPAPPLGRGEQAVGVTSGGWTWTGAWEVGRAPGGQGRAALCD